MSKKKKRANFAGDVTVKMEAAVLRAMMSSSIGDAIHFAENNDHETAINVCNHVWTVGVAAFGEELTRGIFSDRAGSAAITMVPLH